jgi:hypothetical protein
MGICRSNFVRLPPKSLTVLPNFRIRLRKEKGNLPLDLWSLATEGTQEFPPLKKSFACHRRDARISIAEKISIFARTNFCRYATMRVANSRLFTVAELQIRQNKGKKRSLAAKGTQEFARTKSYRRRKASSLSNRRSE